MIGNLKLGIKNSNGKIVWINEDKKSSIILTKDNFTNSLILKLCFNQRVKEKNVTSCLNEVSLKLDNNDYNISLLTRNMLKELNNYSKIEVIICPIFSNDLNSNKLKVYEQREYKVGDFYHLRIQGELWNEKESKSIPIKKCAYNFYNFYNNHFYKKFNNLDKRDPIEVLTVINNFIKKLTSQDKIPNHAVWSRLNLFLIELKKYINIKYKLRVKISSSIDFKDYKKSFLIMWYRFLSNYKEKFSNKWSPETFSLTHFLSRLDPVFLDTQDKLLNGEGKLGLANKLIPIHILYKGSKTGLDSRGLEDRVLSTFYFTYFIILLGDEEKALKNLEKDIRILGDYSYESKYKDFYKLIVLCVNVINMKIKKKDKKLARLFTHILPYADKMYEILYENPYS